MTESVTVHLNARSATLNADGLHSFRDRILEAVRGPNVRIVVVEATVWAGKIRIANDITSIT